MQLSNWNVTEVGPLTDAFLPVREYSHDICEVKGIWNSNVIIIIIGVATILQTFPNIPCKFIFALHNYPTRLLIQYQHHPVFRYPSVPNGSQIASRASVCSSLREDRAYTMPVVEAFCHQHRFLLGGPSSGAPEAKQGTRPKSEIKTDVWFPFHERI